MGEQDSAAVTPQMILDRANATAAEVESLKAENGKLRTEHDATKAALAALQDRVNKGTISLPGSEEAAKKYSVGRAVRALVTGDWSKAGVELEVHREAYKALPDSHQARTMTTATPSAGGFLIPEELATTIVPKMDAMSVCKAAGATVVRPNGWPFKVNTVTGGTTAAYAAENASVSATDLTIGQIALNPRKIGARTFMTAEQVQYGTPQTDALVLADLMLRAELLQDKWALKGSGVGGEPVGITSTTGINTNAGIDTGKLTYADIAIAIQFLEEDNVNTDGGTVILHPTQKGELFRNVNATVSSGTLANEGAAYVMGTPFMTPALFKQLTGYNLATTSQMTDGTGLFGVFKWLWMAEWGGVVIGRSDVASDGTNHAFFVDGLHLKVTKWVDSAVVLPTAFHTITSI